uniref:Leucine-rich repeats and calponin homology (CH) domain containing 2 n=1 Tax=Gouania willdenowi TaxID=441366 RepID=A0A8C5FZN2_GOUWI
MASSHGGVGAVSAAQSHPGPSGPHWSPVQSQNQSQSQYQNHHHHQNHQNHQNHQHQQHLSARSLDRALEDAVCSGILNLSGRKLREYPGMSFDLTDTTQADLSKNRLTDVPPEVCLFAPLESLNLYHNCIKFIPEAIVNLQMLTYIDVSRNLLTILPKYLFNLPLKVLLVSNNKLVSIPEEIGRAKELMELDVSCNEIQVLPAQVGRLQALRELNIRKNCLHMLPEELADLPLIRLDFSCNKITEIPPTYRKLRHLQHIILDNNPMQSPPAQICLKGKVHIFKYLNIQVCRMEKKPDTLDLPTMEDFYPSKNHGPDSGIGSDNGDKRLSTTEVLDGDLSFSRGSKQELSSTEPSFTMRRKMEHLREELEQIGLLRQNIESRLKVLLPDDVGAALMDGVVLCHLANHISPRSVSSIHVPSPAVPKLSMAKCRRNVENFLDACKRLGVPQDHLCLPHHILEERGLMRVGVTVQALLDLSPSKPTQVSSL